MKTGSLRITEISLHATIERWPVAGAFTIARGSKRHVDVMLVEARRGGRVGRGEGTAIYYQGESAESCLAQIASLGALGKGTVPAWGLSPRDAARAAERAGWGQSPSGDSPSMMRLELQSLLPPGAARNAVDCALWALEAAEAGVPVWRLAGALSPGPVETAMTVSLDTPEAMEARARTLATRFATLKLKLAGNGDGERVAAVRCGAPHARLIVDANESWHGRDIAREAAALLAYGVELIEQPVRAGHDHLLDGVTSPIPLCADESLHDRADLQRCAGRYAAINIKLDKCGGLTEALALRNAARAMGLRIMVGCMLGTSLAMAPARIVAEGADWVDLDGALLLAEDRDQNPE